MIDLAIVALSIVGFLISSYFTAIAYRWIRPDERWIPASCRMGEQTCASIVFTPRARVFGLPNSVLGQVYVCLADRRRAARPARTRRVLHLVSRREYLDGAVGHLPHLFVTVHHARAVHAVLYIARHQFHDFSASARARIVGGQPEQERSRRGRSDQLSHLVGQNPERDPFAIGVPFNSASVNFTACASVTTETHTRGGRGPLFRIRRDRLTPKSLPLRDVWTGLVTPARPSLAGHYLSPSALR